MSSTHQLFAFRIERPPPASNILSALLFRCANPLGGRAMRQKVPAVIFAVLVLIIGAEYLSWRVRARVTLVEQLPSMLREGLLSYEQRMAGYDVRPKEVQLVLGRTLPERLASDVRSFREAYQPAAVTVATERQAVEAGVLVNFRCSGCTVVNYEEQTNNPFFGRVSVSLSGGDHAVGYEHICVNVFGKWVHVRTRFLWIM